MATLLHLDSSMNGDNSTSRAATAIFRRSWEAECPESVIIYRDLAAEPLPHLSAPAYYAGFVPPGERTPEQQADSALSESLIGELEAADAILIGAPMYNYTVPSTLKVWLDHVTVVGRTALIKKSLLAGKPAVVVASRGGTYAPGTPREGREYVLNYLQTVLGDALGLQVDFIVPELTIAPVIPRMAEQVPLFEASRTKALEDAETKGRSLAAKFAA